MNILERELNGDEIYTNDSEYHLILNNILEVQKVLTELNNNYHVKDEVRNIMSIIIGKSLDESFWLMPPFYTDYGKNITFGKNVFVNHACTFMDRGGITIDDNVLIGPKVNLITINHPIDYKKRLQGVSTLSKPIHIKKNVWIGAAVTILPGITIGENSIVAAGAVVTKNVPDNVMVAGVPAKVIKHI